MTKHMQHTHSQTSCVLGCCTLLNNALQATTTPPASLIYKNCCVHNELNEAPLAEWPLLHS